MSINKNTPTEPNRPASYSRVVLPLLVAACATSGGPTPSEPPAPAAGEPPAAIQPATADDGAATPPSPAEAAAETAGSSSPVATYLEDPDAITAGRRMFRAVCTGYCHSTTAGVTKDAPNLFDCAWDHGSTDADLYRVIVEGVPDTEMLPFGGKIPEDTIWKVIAYVRSNGSDCG